MVTRSCSNLTLVAVSKILKLRLGRRSLLTSVIVNQAHIKLLLFGHEEFQFWPNQNPTICLFSLKNGPFLLKNDLFWDKKCRNCLFSESNPYIIALDIYRLDNYMQNGSKEHDMNGILGVQLAACVIFISNESSK